MKRTLTALTVVAMIFAFLWVVSIPIGAQESNDPGFWEDQFEHPAECFKHEGADLESNIHGTIVDELVFLNEFNPAWFGDHWEALIVKAGSGDPIVTEHPDAGVGYPAPDGREVSHWIVCKGDDTTTTTSTSTSTTDTTASTTTTTSPTTTTRRTTTTETTAPPSTTVTTTPTTAPTTSTTSVVSTTDPPTTNTLPWTGIENDPRLWAGIATALFLLGSLLALGIIRR